MPSNPRLFAVENYKQYVDLFCKEILLMAEKRNSSQLEKFIPSKIASQTYQKINAIISEEITRQYTPKFLNHKNIYHQFPIAQFQRVQQLFQI